jgi:hypothetical protein
MIHLHSARLHQVCLTDLGVELSKQLTHSFPAGLQLVVAFVFLYFQVLELNWSTKVLFHYQFIF